MQALTPRISRRVRNILINLVFLIGVAGGMLWWTFRERDEIDTTTNQFGNQVSTDLEFNGNDELLLAIYAIAEEPRLMSLVRNALVDYPEFVAAWDKAGDWHIYKFMSGNDPYRDDDVLVGLVTNAPYYTLRKRQFDLNSGFPWITDGYVLETPDYGREELKSPTQNAVEAVMKNILESEARRYIKNPEWPKVARRLYHWRPPKGSSDGMPAKHDLHDPRSYMS